VAKQRKRAGNRHSENGEFRRRWEVMWESGCFVRLGAQGLRMAHWVARKVNWSTCEIYVSVRQIASQMGVGTSTVQRGINELVTEGMIKLVRGGGPGRSSVYVVPNRAPVGNSSAPDGGALVPGGRVQAHLPPGTTAPPYGSNRAPVRVQPRPHMEQNAINSIGIHFNTNGVSNAETAGAGRKPARRLRRIRAWTDEAAEPQNHQEINRDDNGDGSPPADPASA
jgi:hypothetical protein